MLLLENILSQEVVQKLGWTLLHFVWQATADCVFRAGSDCFIAYYYHSVGAGFSIIFVGSY